MADNKEVLLYPTASIKWIARKVKREGFPETTVRTLHQLYVSEDMAMEKWVEVPTEGEKEEDPKS